MRRKKPPSVYPIRLTIEEALESSRRYRDNFEAFEAEANAIFVLPDNSEIRFQRRLKWPIHRYGTFAVANDEPPHLVVEVRDEFEFTITRNRGDGSPSYPWFPVPPRGLGWELYDSSGDEKTTWRRPVPSLPSQEPVVMELCAVRRVDGKILNYR